MKNIHITFFYHRYTNQIDFVLFKSKKDVELWENYNKKTKYLTMPFTSDVLENLMIYNDDDLIDANTVPVYKWKYKKGPWVACSKPIHHINCVTFSGRK